MNLTDMNHRVGALVEAYRALWSESVKLRRWQLVVPAVLAGSGLLCQVSAIALSLYYTKHLVTNQGVFLPFQLTPSPIVPQDSMMLLALVSSTILGLLVLYALFTFFSNRIAIQLAMAFELHCTRKLLKRIGEQTALSFTPIKNTEEMTGIVRTLLADSRACGRALFIALTSIVPFVVVAIATLWLFKTNAAVTAFLVPVALLYFLPLYRLNLFGVSSSRSLETVTPLIWRKLQGIVRTIKDHSLPDSTGAASIDDDADLKTYARSYAGIVELPFRGGLVNDLFLSFVLPGILVGLGFMAIRGRSEWHLIPVYLISLRYFASHLKTLSTKLTAVNRFFPQIERTMNLLADEVRNELPRAKSGPQSHRVIGFYVDRVVTRYNILEMARSIGETTPFLVPASPPPSSTKRFESFRDFLNHCLAYGHDSYFIPMECEHLLTPQEWSEIFHANPTSLFHFFTKDLLARSLLTDKVVWLSAAAPWRGTYLQFQSLRGSSSATTAPLDPLPILDTVTGDEGLEVDDSI